jgi:hypothetical protein
MSENGGILGFAHCSSQRVGQNQAHVAIVKKFSSMPCPRKFVSGFIDSSYVRICRAFEPTTVVHAPVRAHVPIRKSREIFAATADCCQTCAQLFPSTYSFDVAPRMPRHRWEVCGSGLGAFIEKTSEITPTGYRELTTLPHREKVPVAATDTRRHQNSSPPTFVTSKTKK